MPRVQITAYPHRNVKVVSHDSGGPRGSALRQEFATYLRRSCGASRRSPRSTCHPACLPRRPCDALAWTMDLCTAFLAQGILGARI
jgi:hypothetical protein